MTYLVRCNDEANVISPDDEPISCIHCLWGEAGNRAVIQESGAPWRTFSAPINPLVLPWVGHWWIGFCLFTRIKWQSEPASLISGDTGAHQPAVLFLLFGGMVAPYQGTNIPHKKPRLSPDPQPKICCHCIHLPTSTHFDPKHQICILIKSSVLSIWPQWPWQLRDADGPGIQEEAVVLVDTEMSPECKY